MGRFKYAAKCKGASVKADGDSAGADAMVGVGATPRARPPGLQSNRADLLKSLALEPTVSRSVGLVR